MPALLVFFGLLRAAKKTEQVILTAGQGVRAEFSDEGTAGHIRTSGQAFRHGLSVGGKQEQVMDCLGT